MKLKLKHNGSLVRDITVSSGITPSEIITTHELLFPRIVTAAKYNNQLISLATTLHEDGILEFLDITSLEGMRVYQDSLSCVFIRAAMDLFDQPRISIKHSISDGLYIETYSRFLLTENDVTKLRKKMKEFIDSDEPFVSQFVTPAQAHIIFKNDKTKQELIPFIKTKKIQLYKFGTVTHLFNGPLVPSTGYLQLFDLQYFPPGMVLRMPSPTDTTKMGPFKPQPNLLKVFTDYERWGDILNLAYVPALNKAVDDYKIDEIIQVSEALHEKKIARIADDIDDRRNEIGLILITGPSGSGKTTFSKRLAIQLKANGLRSHTISLDDYFLNREDTPKDEKGEYDFETIDALDKNLVNKQVRQLLDGKQVTLPKFDFITGKREKVGTKLRLEPHTILIIEGIHGLNEALTSSVPRKQKFKIYVSALTQLNLHHHNRISTSDTRIIRRIVRDSFFRGYSATQTIQRWNSIRRGEQKFVFSFQEDADVMFNSALVYELGVLKKYAMPALKKVPKEVSEYTIAQRLIQLLDCFKTIPENVIPPTSIIREFIAGSSFKY